MPHFVGGREPAEAVGNFRWIGLPYGVVAVPDAGNDLAPVEVGKGGFYLGQPGAQVDAWLFRWWGRGAGVIVCGGH